MSAPPLLKSLPAGLVWQADRLASPAKPGLPTGFPALDAVLPGGGWPPGALIEVLCERPGQGELSLLLPLLRATPAQHWCAWVAPPFLPYAPALAAQGLPLERMLFLRPEGRAAQLWATRQTLASGACAQVLAWLPEPDTAALRRLHLAAEDSDTPLFLFRPASAARQPSPASLRLAVRGRSEARLEIRLLKRRGPPLAEPLELDLHRLPRPYTPAAPFHQGRHAQPEALPDAMVCATAAGPAPARLHPGLCR